MRMEREAEEARRLRQRYEDAAAQLGRDREAHAQREAAAEGRARALEEKERDLRRAESEMRAREEEVERAALEVSARRRALDAGEGLPSLRRRDVLADVNLCPLCGARRGDCNRICARMRPFLPANSAAMSRENCLLPKA